MDINTIMCEHPTLNRKGLISEPIDLVCVKPDCTYPNRYACEFCRSEHQHYDQFVRVTKICQFLETQKQGIDQEVQKKYEQGNIINQALTKLLKMIENIKEQIQMLLQQDYFVQLQKVLQANEICKTKQQIQKIGDILKKITKCQQNQLEFVMIHVENTFDKEKLKTSIQQLVNQLFQQIESFGIIPVQQAPEEAVSSLLLSKLDQIKQESNQVIESINLEKQGQYKQINKLTTQVDTLYKIIQDLKVQLQKQGREKLKDQEVFKQLKIQEQSQQEKREESLRKLQKIKEIQIKENGTKTKNRKLNANAGKGGAMEALCKNLSDPINFDKQPGIQLTENTFEIYYVSLPKKNFEQKLDKVWEIDVDKDFLEKKESNSWNCIRTTKIFAEGQMKAVYLMKRKSLGKEVYVIKQPLGQYIKTIIYGMTYTTLRDAKMECRSHMISKAFLSAFIDKLTLAKQKKGSPLFIPNVEYSNFLILQDKPNSFWIAERFYEGEFVKYNNNYGWISEENNDQNQLAQAYSYYTYFSSNFTAVVNDIQGVGQFWTDPALNTTNEHLDQTDMGKDGIAMFLVTYQQKSNCGKKYLDLLGIKIQQ